ncbi:MAG: CPBP family intramembrane metalloprotease [Anaerolineae bacterium]|nr:CPBP family intramembrane metalloprotease [Anaerolineae bacterium]
MISQFSHYKTFSLLVLCILGIFIARTLLAVNGNPPQLDNIFTMATLIGSTIVFIKGYQDLHTKDWIIALSLGALVGMGMSITTIFTPYPFFGIVRDNLGQALVRGFSVTLAILGGMVIMHWGGPISFPAAKGEWGKSGSAILFGLLVGLPLAIFNIFALKLTEGKDFLWQNPLSALLDAFQPAIVEEVIYRFALWGLLWLVLRKSIQKQSVFLAGLMATMVHTYQHFDALFVQSPWVALGMGMAMALIWGLPSYFLARRRGIESAIAFHWIQDVERFFAGF